MESVFLGAGRPVVEELLPLDVRLVEAARMATGLWKNIGHNRCCWVAWDWARCSKVQDLGRWGEKARQ
jgi:hypothetical protein